MNNLERKTAFLLAAIILSALVSISFYNLDRHPSFSPISKKMLVSINASEAPIIFAEDPIALAALEQQRHNLDPAVFPLTTWPPEALVLAANISHPAMQAANMKLRHDEGLWSLWIPHNYSPLPFFGLATLETEGHDGDVHICPRDIEGGYQCGDAGWTRMRYRTITVNSEPETCIWSHPIKDRTLRFRFPNVTNLREEGYDLWMETALRDASIGTGTSVDVTIRLGGDEVEHRHRDRRGWQSVRIPESLESQELILEISGEETGRRHFCYRFDLR